MYRSWACLILAGFLVGGVTDRCNRLNNFELPDFNESAQLIKVLAPEEAYASALRSHDDNAVAIRDTEKD